MGALASAFEGDQCRPAEDEQPVARGMSDRVCVRVTDACICQCARARVLAFLIIDKN